MYKFFFVCLILSSRAQLTDFLGEQQVELNLPNFSPLEPEDAFDSTFDILLPSEASLPSVGDSCDILTSDDGQEYYDCSFGCLYDNNLDKSEELEFQCDVIATNSCRINGNFDKYNFFSVLYCSFNGSIIGYLVVSIIIIMLIMKFISATVEEFVCPGITYMADAMKMSESMAAVTLVALANGAGDVITALVAGSSAGGVSYNIGALYGSGFFVCSIVISMTIFSLGEHKLEVSPTTIKKDVAFYIFATLVTIAFGAIGFIYWWSAALFLVIYVALVVVTFLQSTDKKEEAKNEPKEDEKPDAQESNEVLLPKKRLSDKMLSSGFFKNIQKGGKIKALEIALDDFRAHSKADRKKLGRQITTQKTREAKKVVEDKVVKKEEDQKEEEHLTWDEMGWCDRISFIIDQPFKYIRAITMPPSNKDEYNKYYTIIWPIPGFLFLSYAFGCFGKDFLYYGIPAAIVLTILVYLWHKKLETNEIPKHGFILIALISTLIGLVWTFVLSEMLIDLLNTYIVIAKLDNTYMGLTVIGIGNALPDALTTIELAQHPESVQMGITGSYSGQLFGLLVGFGLAQLKTTLTLGPQQFDLFSDPMSNLLDIIIIFISLANLVITAVVAKSQNYVFTKCLAYTLGGLYIFMFVVVTGVQIWYVIVGIP